MFLLLKNVIFGFAIFLVSCGTSYSKEIYVPEPIPSDLFQPVIVEPLPSKKPRPRPSVKSPKPIVTVKETTKPPVITGRVPSVVDAKNYARSVLGAVQYACIDQIFIHESHWNPYDLNRLSGAYGIPQALPGSKMAVIASDWRTNPITQVKWGIRYVDRRYGSACAAWSFWQRNQWY